MSKFIFVFVGFFHASMAFSAPAPGAATSAITNPQLGLFNSPHGFRISAGTTDWHITSPPPETKYIVTMYQAPNKTKDIQGSLTVRVDNLKKSLPLNDYVQQWMRDYGKFGFEVLGSKPFSHFGTPGYVIDLRTKSSNKQLRQVVFVREKKAVILTCRDHVDNFENTLKSCNSIVKTFAWNKLTPEEAATAAATTTKPATPAAPQKAQDDSSDEAIDTENAD